MKHNTAGSLALDWLTREQATEILQVTTKTIDIWIKDGRLEARKPAPGTVRIPASAIERLMS
jgi:excisionase family DNA binding protein